MMGKKFIFLLLVFLFFLIHLSFYISSANSENYEISKYVISGGGANATSGNFLTGLTIGELTGKLISGDIINSVGFWYTLLDTTPPTVIIISPTATTYTSSSVAVRIDMNEPGYCEYSLNGGATNVTLTPNASSSSFTGTAAGLSNQAYTLNAYCNDSFGNKNYGESVTFTVDVPTTPPSGGETPSGGAVTPPCQITVSPTYFDTKLAILTGEPQTITVTNTGANAVNITPVQVNLNSQVKFSFEPPNFLLGPRATQKLKVTFSALSQTGIFTDKIKIDCAEVLTSSDVRTVKLLFDSNIAVLNENYTVEQGDKLRTQVTLIPLGDPARLDVTLNYVIKDYTGKIYLTQTETLLVEDQMDFDKNFDTGILPIGKYIVGLELVYPSGVAPSSAHFEVVEKKPTGLFGKIVFFLIILILIVAILIVVLLIRRTMKNKNAEEENVVQ
jgi:hypothetical protein